MHQYKELKVCRKSISIANYINEITENFACEEIFGLVAKLRRVCVSISSNIAEGVEKNSSKSFIQFLEIANGSSYELDTQIIIIKNQN